VRSCDGVFLNKLLLLLLLLLMPSVTHTTF
jgi:hypothetical protein